jgi:hypothetical protein
MSYTLSHRPSEEMREIMADLKLVYFNLDLI